MNKLIIVDDTGENSLLNCLSHAKGNQEQSKRFTVLEITGWTNKSRQNRDLTLK